MIKRLTIKLVFVSLVLCTFLTSKAQIPDGSFVPNFEAPDINGQVHNLYELLSQGYKVVIDVSATWCGPCWDYHITGALEDLHHTYGPDGTQEIFVLFIEGDDATTLDQLYGIGSGTAGNWVENTPYPIIDDAGYIAELLEVQYYPTIYTVCSDGRIYESERKTTQQHYDYATTIDCQANDNDVSLSSFTRVIASCEGPIDAKIDLYNVGANEITDANIILEGCESCPIIQSWSGTLGYFEKAEIEFKDLLIDENLTELTFRLESEDDNVENNEFKIPLALGAVDVLTNWTIELLTDCYPGESSWNIVDAEGTEVVTSEPYTTNDSLHIHNFTLPADGCYTLFVNDAYGDGFNGTAFDCENDGAFKCFADETVIMEIDGQENFATKIQNAVAAGVSSNENILINSFTISPNPAMDNFEIMLTDNSSRNATMDLMDIQGRIIMTQKLVQQKNRVNISSLDAGFYIVNVKTAQGQYSKKLIVE